MKISSQSFVDYRSASISQLPVQGFNTLEMIVPGASSTTIGSTSCSCGALALKK